MTGIAQRLWPVRRAIQPYRKNARVLNSVGLKQVLGWRWQRLCDNLAVAGALICTLLLDDGRVHRMRTTQ
jgi:hypothetical protein